jgi:hypothetical protein
MKNEWSNASNGRWPIIGMLRLCASPGCTTITLGGFCVAHDQVEAPERDIPFGQLFEPPVAVGAGETANSV